MIPGRAAALSLSLLLASCAAPPQADWSRAETVTVRMTEYRFAPAQLAFRHGQPYRLVLVNGGREHHEFTAPAFLKQATIRDPSVLVAGGAEVALQPGETKTVELVAPAAGRYPLICADHDTFGMDGAITVE